jgi:hypothetical protein
VDNLNYQPDMLIRLVQERVLADDPFVLIDVGCAMGIHPLWRSFGEDLRAHGFDAQEDECVRLRAKESSSQVHYHAAFVGLPPSHPFHRDRVTAKRIVGTPFSASHQLDRSSTFLAAARKRAQAAAQPSSSRDATEQWQVERLAPRTVAISDFAAERDLANIDFVKIDTDGRDLEAAVSCREAIRRTSILGFEVECVFAGTDDSTENSFHNIDGFMRENGFSLFGLTSYRYSRAALPAPFLYQALYQTVSGQPVWGDMVYLRDAAAADDAAIWGGELAPTKLLKLACLYELFALPDCAAELIVTHRNKLRALADPQVLLDLLTPPLRGVQRSYNDYLRLFEDDVEAFLPSP